MFEPDVANLNYDLISSSRGTMDHDMLEYRMIENNPYVGKNYLDVSMDLKKTHNSVLIGLSRKIGNVWQLITNAPDEEVVQVNDYLVLMCSGSSKKKFVSVFGVEEGRVIE